MEGRDLEQEQARKARQSRMEHFILEWMAVYPVMSLAAGFAVMIGLGALHTIDSRVPAAGWWTSLGIVASALAVIRIIKYAIERKRS